MFGTIRKHQTWLWLVIIVFTIIAFVIFFTPGRSNPLGGRNAGGNYGIINGKPITESIYQRAWREVQLQFRFNYGDWPTRERMDMVGFDLQRETYLRVLLTDQIQERDIQVSDATAAHLAKTLLERSGTTYAAFKQLLSDNPKLGITAEDFDRFIRHESGIVQLNSLLGLGGKLVTDKEIEELYRFENQQVFAQVVFFNLSNHLDEVEVKPEAVAQFYTNRMAQYRIPDRVQVRYVRFDFTNYLNEAEDFLAKMTNVNEIVERMFQQNYTNYFNRGAKSDEEARAMVRDDIKEEFSMREAHQAAARFDSTLLDMESPRSNELDKLAETNGFTVHTSTPFTRDYGPEDLDVPPAFARVAFQLTEESPFGELVQGEDAIFVLAFDQRIPSENPPLDSIREEVAADYRRSRALQTAQIEGAAFPADLAEELDQGKKFSDIAREKGLEAVTLPLFSLRARAGDLPQVEDQMNLQQFLDVAFRTAPGTASRFIPTSNGGLVLFVQSHQPADENKLRSELPKYADYVRQARQSSLFQSWMRQQLEVGNLQVPPSVFGRESGAQ